MRLAALAATGAALVTAALLAGAAPAAADVSAAASFRWTCFGQTGTFKSGTYVETTDWTGDGAIDECFGIAPAGTVWHAWSGSGSWREMPNNGVATNMYDTFFENNRRTVAVEVHNVGVYCSQLIGTWQPWKRC